MELEHGALKVLHGVGLAVDRALLLELVRQRQAVLRETAVALPVGAEAAAYGVARLGKVERVVRGPRRADRAGEPCRQHCARQPDHGPAAPLYVSHRALLSSQARPRRRPALL